MAERVAHFTVTAPASTPQASPLEVALTFAPAVVDTVEIVVPSGHAGLTGIALAQGHRAIIPEQTGTFIIADDEVIRWPLEGYLNNGAWQAFVFNTDVFGHSWHVRFLLSLIRPAPAAVLPAPELAPIEDGLGPAPSLEPDFLDLEEDVPVEELLEEEAGRAGALPASELFIPGQAEPGESPPIRPPLRLR